MLLPSLLAASLMTATAQAPGSRFWVPIAVVPVASSEEALEDVVMGDFDCDGQQDVAAPSYLGSVYVVSGLPGAFRVRATVSGTSFLRGAAAGDFNADGCTDLAAVDSINSRAVALLGSSQGLAPAPGSPLATPSIPWGLDVADLDGDRLDDLVVAAPGTDLAYQFQAQAIGGFTLRGTWPLGRNSVQIQAGDLNGDQRPDLFATNHNVASGSVLLSDGSGGFIAAPGSPLSLVHTPCRPTLVDIDGDGNLDVLVRSGETYQLRWYRGDGHGAFGPGTLIGVDLPFGCAQYAVADLDADGRLDIAIPKGEQILRLTQLASGNFAQSVSEGLPGVFLRALLARDVDGDGRMELLAAANTNSNSLILLLAAPLHATGFE